MSIKTGGTANGTTVDSRGSIMLYSGAVLKGMTSIAGTASVYGTVDAAGTTLNFAVDQRKVDDSFMINDLSLIAGAPAYTITVAADQTFGTYKLAQGAAGFAGTMTIGDTTTDYGTVTVNGGGFFYNGITYTLVQSSGDLTLTVEDITPPENRSWLRILPLRQTKL